MNTLCNLIEYSRRYGADPSLVNAGGGNTSAKQDGVMYIKCSGTALKDASEDSFAAMDMDALMKILTKKYPETDREREAAFLADVMAARRPGEENKRPSVETLLHALFPQKYVLHLHPALVNGLTCSAGGEALAHKLLGEDVVWVSACRPGYILGMMMYEKFKASGKNISIVLLENHGVFFAADTVPELDGMLAGMMKTLGECVREFPETENGTPEPGYGTSLAAKWGSKGAFCFTNSRAALDFARSREAAADMLTPFDPDQVVYCGPDAQFIENIDNVDKITSRVAVVRGVGIYTFGPTEKAARNALMLTEDAMKIAIYSRSFGGPKHLSDELVSFLVNWEAESYRKSL